MPDLEDTGTDCRQAAYMSVCILSVFAHTDSTANQQPTSD